MEQNYDSSPASSGSPTPTIPVGGGRGRGAGMPGMMPGMGMPGMGGMMPGLGGMMPPMGGMGGMMPGYYGMYPWGGMGGMPGMMGMSGMMQGQPGAAGGSRAGVPEFPGDTVYRPSLDFLTGTPDETFSLEELGISPIAETPTESPPEAPAAVGRGGPSRKKGSGRGKRKVVGESSQTAAGEEEEEGSGRTVWSDEQCVALSKAWMAVCDDALVSTNQTIVNMWAKIAKAYKVFHPHGKTYTGEECRKQWDRIRTAVTRFAGIYHNNIRMKTSGQTEEDVRQLSMCQFPEPGRHRQFRYWDAYLALMDCAKFRAGMDAGWPKRQAVNIAGGYSSSAGSHNLPDDAEEAPTPPSFSRRRRPVGQRTAQRMSRGGGSQEVQSAAPSVQPSPELTHLATIQQTQSMADAIKEWSAATDPVHKELLMGLIQSMRRSLGLPPIGGGGASSGGGSSDVAGSGDGGNDQ